MAPFFYALCTFTALVCAWALFRAYRRNGYKLLLWGAICFFGLTLNNGLLVVDRLVVREIDLFTFRLTVALVSTMVLLYGVIWDAE